MTVTRTELTAHIGAAFATGPATRDVLLAHAASSRAHPHLIALIQALPDKPYLTAEAVWRSLPNAPAHDPRSAPYDY